MALDEASLDSVFRLLADETRLRVIRALGECALTVNELAETLGLPQPTVSRHLGIMRKGQLVSDRREGPSIWYSLSDWLLGDRALMNAIEAGLGRVAHERADADRLQAVLDARRSQVRGFFDSVAGSYHNLVRPGGGDIAMVAAFALALNPVRAADLGCGEGEVSLRLARAGLDVTAVDSSSAMIRRLKQRARREGIHGVRALVGDVEALPLKAGEFDLVFLSQTLHHALNPAKVVGEAVRIARVGGKVVIVDLQRHDMEWTRDKLGDQWLGFRAEVILDWMRDFGLTDLRLETVEVDGGLPVFAACGIRGRRVSVHNKARRVVNGKHSVGT